MSKRLTVILAMMVMGSVANAQTRTVAATGADWTTINDAINDVIGDPATPDVVRIIGPAVDVDMDPLTNPLNAYDESIPQIASSITIEGFNYRPIIAIQLGTLNDGLSFAIDGDLTLRNFVLIPSESGPPLDDAMYISTASASGTLNLLIDNVYVTPNAGNQVPVTYDTMTMTYDPFTKVDLTAIPGPVTKFGDDGIFIMSSTGFGGNGGKMNVTIDDVVVTHLDNTTGPDHFIIGGVDAPLTADDMTVNILGGTTVTFGRRFGFQLLRLANFNIQGTPTDPVLALGCNFGGVSFAGKTDISNLVVDNSGASNNTVAGFNYCWRVDPDTAEAFTMKESYLANSADRGLWIAPFTPANLSLVTVDDTTFHNNVAGISVDSTNVDSTLTINVTDSIFSGDSVDALADYAFDNIGTPVFNVSNSAIVTAGAYALTGDLEPNVGGTPTLPTLASIINDDPGYVSLAVLTGGVFNTDLADVTNGAYAGAGTAGSDLTGYGDLVAAPGVPGDVDGDGLLTVADVTEYGNFFAGVTGSLTVPGNGDYNADTVVNAADAAALAAALVN